MLLYVHVTHRLEKNEERLLRPLFPAGRTRINRRDGLPTNRSEGAMSRGHNVGICAMSIGLSEDVASGG